MDDEYQSSITLHSKMAISFSWTPDVPKLLLKSARSNYFNMKLHPEVTRRESENGQLILNVVHLQKLLFISLNNIFI